MADESMDITQLGPGALAGAGGAVGGPMGALIGGAIGLGLSIFGGVEKAEAAKKQTDAQVAMIGIEQKQDAVRRQAMEVQARRQQMEVLRNNQRARSLALNNATNQGAQFGSGLQGGYGQISGQSSTNLLGISQNLEAGENMFDLNAQLNQQKIAYAQAGGQLNTASAIQSAGTSVLGALGPINNLAKNFS